MTSWPPNSIIPFFKQVYLRQSICKWKYKVINCLYCKCYRFNNILFLQSCFCDNTINFMIIPAVVSPFCSLKILIRLEKWLISDWQFYFILYHVLEILLGVIILTSIKKNISSGREIFRNVFDRRNVMNINTLCMF